MYDFKIALSSRRMTRVHRHKLATSDLPAQWVRRERRPFDHPSRPSATRRSNSVLVSARVASVGAASDGRSSAQRPQNPGF